MKLSEREMRTVIYTIKISNTVQLKCSTMGDLAVAISVTA